MKGFFSALLFAALAAGLGWMFGPPLWQDLRLRGEKLVAVADGRITEAKCQSKLFVVTWCDVNYDRGGASGSFAYLLFGRLGGERVGLQRAPGASGALTTTLGMDYLIDRVIAFIVFMALMVGLTFGGILMMRRKASGPGEPQREPQSSDELR